MEMLTVKNIYKSFGGLMALAGVSLEVRESAIMGLVGPNGSGKTTLFNILSGFYRKDQGEIFFKGERIDGLSPNEIAMKGLQRSFQVSKAPEGMTVLENMLVAPRIQSGEKVHKAFCQFRKVQKEERKNLNWAFRWLTLLELDQLCNEDAANLSGGQKKLLSLGRLLMAGADLILLDEPTAGVNPTLTNNLLKKISQLREEEGKTFFIVEHNMNVIRSICDKCICLDSGKKIAEGTPESVCENDEVLAAYLGGKHSASKGRK